MVSSQIESSVMSHWNYRIVKKTVDGEDLYGIHEYYYDADGRYGWTEDAVEVIADSVEGIKWVLESMMLALDRPVIEDEE